MQTDNPKAVYVLFRRKIRVDMEVRVWEIYVGITENLAYRLEHHSKLGLYPEKDYEVARCFLFTNDGCGKQELDLTHGLALQFGYQNVKGSNYTTTSKESQLKEMCCAITDRCYGCFEMGKKKSKHPGCKNKKLLPGTHEHLSLEKDVPLLSAIFCQ